MAEVTKTKFIKKNGWRTLEWGWNTTFRIRFFNPAGAKVKVRFGVGWFGWNGNSATLTGNETVILTVNAGVTTAKVQIYVTRDTDVTYTYLPF